MSSKFDFLSPGIQITEVDESALPVTPEADGPIIIGRTRKGPAMKPVKVRSLEDYVSIFGTPLPGGDSPSGDIWRDGAGSAAPTYAGYAAQAWLASENSPVTVVRLLGKHHSAADADAERAGWKCGANAGKPTGSALRAENATAYGLFVIDSGSLGSFKTRGIKMLQADSGSYELTVNDATAGATTLLVWVTGNVGSSLFEFDIGQTAGVANAGAVKVDILDHADATAIATTFANTIATKIDDGTLGSLSVYTDGAEVFIRNHSADNLFITSSNVVTGAVGNAEGTGPTYNQVSAVQGAGKATGFGALAAIMYADAGSLALKGRVDSGDIGAAGTEYSRAAQWVRSSGTGVEFQLHAKDAAGNDTEQKVFNFDRNSSNYIRSSLNTNPARTNSNVYDTTTNYWLGESFERHLKTYVTSSGRGDQWGILMPLHMQASSSEGNYNWSHRKESMRAAKSGWVIGNDNGVASNYTHEGAAKMFRVELLHEGSQIQADILIAFEDLTLPTNPTVYKYSSFTLRVMDAAGNTLEKYSGLVMDPDSDNYILRRIGNMSMTWDEDSKRYRVIGGDFVNKSDYIRVILPDAGLPDDKGLLPFGFLGPVRPKHFTLASGSTVTWAPGAIGSSGGTANSHAYVLGSGSCPEHPETGYIGSLVNDDGGLSSYSASFYWPAIKMRANGAEGFAPNPFKCYWGARPKIGTDTKTHDEDYCDYLRGLPSGDATQIWDLTGTTHALEYSIKFSLDDIKVLGTTVTWSEGSRKGETSFTATSGSAELLKKGISRWVMPVWGGSDGLEVKELEPFRNGLLNEANAVTEDHLVNTLDVALASVTDEEVCPANLMLMPGIYKKKFTSQMISVCEQRQDCLAIVDLDGDYRPSYDYPKSTDDQRKPIVSTTIDNLKARNINSSYACTFFPWVQVVDTINNNQILWVPSSVAALGAMASSEAESEIWFAPAGFNRGGLGNLGGSAGPRVVQARMRLDSGERDDLYVQNINPIATFPNEGVVIFGQKTLQSTKSALDRINVRRLMLYLKRQISNVAKTVLFDQNVEATWNRFKNEADPILSAVQAKYGLTEYKLVLDSTTTTADLIDQNILYAKVYLKPARAIEFIAIDFIISKTGAEFA